MVTTLLLPAFLARAAPAARPAVSGAGRGARKVATVSTRNPDMAVDFGTAEGAEDGRARPTALCEGRTRAQGEAALMMAIFLGSFCRKEKRVSADEWVRQHTLTTAGASARLLNTTRAVWWKGPTSSLPCVRLYTTRRRQTTGLHVGLVQCGARIKIKAQINFWISGRSFPPHMSATFAFTNTSPYRYR